MAPEIHSRPILKISTFPILYCYCTLSNVECPIKIGLTETIVVHMCKMSKLEILHRVWVHLLFLVHFGSQPLLQSTNRRSTTMSKANLILLGRTEHIWKGLAEVPAAASKMYQFWNIPQWIIWRYLLELSWTDLFDLQHDLYWIWFRYILIKLWKINASD